MSSQLQVLKIIDSCSIGTSQRIMILVLLLWIRDDLRFFTNWTSHLHQDSLKVSLIIFSLNMVEYPMSFLSLSTWNDFIKFLTFRGRGPQGRDLNHTPCSACQSDPLKIRTGAVP